MVLSPDAIQTLAVIVFCFGLLVFSRYPADAILVGGVGLLTLLDIITAEEARIGMSNEGMATVAMRLVVARGWLKPELSVGCPPTCLVVQKVQRSLS